MKAKPRQSEIIRRAMLDAPDTSALKSKRDRAILATLLYHALRRDELCRLKVKDFKQERRDVPYIKISGKGGKTRYVPLHPAASGLIHDYLNAAGHGFEDTGALFRSASNNRVKESQKPITPDGVYKLIQKYSGESIKKWVYFSLAFRTPKIREILRI